MQSVTPECTHSGLGSSHFARRYFGNRCFFLFLRLLRCFSSAGSLPYVMDWRMDDWSLSSRVSPFRDPWIKGYLLLPMAFRSLSRLSSALSAKASALCSFLLDLRYIALYRFFFITVWFPIRFSVCFSDVWFLWKSFLKIILCMKFSRYILLLVDCFISHQKTKSLLSSDHW